MIKVRNPAELVDQQLSHDGDDWTARFEYADGSVIEMASSDAQIHVTSPNRNLRFEENEIVVEAQ